MYSVAPRGDLAYIRFPIPGVKYQICSAIKFLSLYSQTYRSCGNIHVSTFFLLLNSLIYISAGNIIIISFAFSLVVLDLLPNFFVRCSCIALHLVFRNVLCIFQFFSLGLITSLEVILYEVLHSLYSL